MTPSDYTEFREALGQSSGFQSAQYRRIEFILGNRNRAMLKPHAHRPETRRRRSRPSSPAPTSTPSPSPPPPAPASPVPPAALAAARRPAQADPRVTAMWAEVYRDPRRHWPIYELAEKLVDLEDYFRRWRFNHVTTVERVIGLKRGTGGTGGVSYLRRMLDVVLFPELWDVRTAL